MYKVSNAQIAFRLFLRHLLNFFSNISDCAVLSSGKIKLYR